MTAAEMAAGIPDGAVIAVAASGGGLVEPDEIFAAIEERFLATGAPRDLTLIHALGFGDRDRRGANRFAHPGMVRRVIGGHWTWSKGMQDLARENRIEAYSLPGGVISLLLRESGAGRPGLITKTGLGTFVDPDNGGGRINTAATEPLVRHITIEGETYLHYLPLKVDFAILKGTYADLRGNLTFSEEPADLDAYAAALAAHNNGGKVFAQVRASLQPGALHAREVRVPGIMVDGVHVVPEQSQTYRGGYDLSLAGRLLTASDTPPDLPPTGLKRILALRAAEELVEGAAVNFGFGASAGIAAIIAERGQNGAYWTTIEQGIHGGTMMIGNLFGMAVNPMAILGATDQFDFYHGGGLDVAFLGMAEFDRAGNVNVSHIGGQFIGPGGFIDITQNARKVVFCGTFDAKGSQIEVEEGRLDIRRHGQIRKLRDQVDAITFSGAQAQKRGQTVIYVTERAVFELRPEGVTLTEIAPGVDLQRDILDQMDFAPILQDPRPMNPEHFRP
ncbi:acyl CoA:acetate/3-ketoacid CoA transferase [Arvimicrobium flavum]|uniref:acyl CoA:acetate/3-ketoacid CoA transferase n=1 Tax=Arvimicrobium flavum TaxID=3393320 RepID=UPI00237A4071|nr:CoA-transferase [Mesorhizobium shangrilense]